MLKKCLLLSLIPIAVQAKSLSTLEDIKHEIMMGNSIRTTVDFSRCQPSMPVQMFYQPRAIAITKKHIAFTSKHLTTNGPRFPGKAILENTTFHISDNNYELSIRYLDPKNYQRLTEEDTTITCQLNDGAKIFAND